MSRKAATILLAIASATVVVSFGSAVLAAVNGDTGQAVAAFVVMACNAVPAAIWWSTRRGAS